MFVIEVFSTNIMDIMMDKSSEQKKLFDGSDSTFILCTKTTTTPYLNITQSIRNNRALASGQKSKISLESDTHTEDENPHSDIYIDSKEVTPQLYKISSKDMVTFKATRQIVDCL